MANIQYGAVDEPSIRRLSLRCPECRQNGVFDAVKDVADVFSKLAQGLGPSYFFVSRVCPNEDCKRLVFSVVDARTRKIARSYPAERLDVDAKNIPSKVLSALNEAITCHAECCYVASAMMIRKCLEELCQDKHVEAKNLRDRLLALREKVVLPNELFEALDHLRLLGNDAAHVEARTYDAVSRDEVEAAIELAKEILKAVYQLDGLVARLRALQKGT